MKLFTQSFKNLFFAALAMVAGRVVAFPVEVTTLTKGGTTIVNVKTHRGVGTRNTINTQSLFEYAQKNNALVLVAPDRPLDLIFKRQSKRESFFTCLAKNMPQDRKVLWIDPSDNHMDTFEGLLDLPILQSPFGMYDSTIEKNLYIKLAKSLRQQFIQIHSLVMPQSLDAANLMKKTNPQLFSFYKNNLTKIKNGQASRYLRNMNEHSSDDKYEKALFANSLHTFNNLKYKLIDDFSPLNDILIVANIAHALDKGEKNIIVCTDKAHADITDSLLESMGFIKTTLRSRSSNKQPRELMLEPILERSSYVLHAMATLPGIKQLLELIYSAYPRC